MKTKIYILVGFILFLGAEMFGQCVWRTNSSGTWVDASTGSATWVVVSGSGCGTKPNPDLGALGGQTLNINHDITGSGAAITHNTNNAASIVVATARTFTAASITKSVSSNFTISGATATSVTSISGAVSVSSGTLTRSGAGNFSAGSISLGGGAVHVTSNGTNTVTGAIAFTGPSSTLRVTNTLTGGSVTNTGYATMTIDGGGTLNTTGGFTSSGGGSAVNATVNLNIGGTFLVSNGSGFTANGNVTANNYTQDGGTGVNFNGTLNVTNTISLSNDATVNINGTTTANTISVVGGADLKGTSTSVSFTTMSFSSGSVCTATTPAEVAALVVPVNLVTCAAILPITLKSFDVRYNEAGDFDFDWLTLTEINNDFFTLEYSLDAKNFTSFAIIKGAGDSNHPLAYTYSESGINTERAAVIYFRLKQTDYAKSFSYSHIEAVSLKGENLRSLFSIYPNPSEGLLTLRYYDWTETEELEFEIYNTLSQERILQVKPSGVETKIDLSYFAKGIYTVQVPSLGYVQKIVLQ
jgi:hypothetical protein